MFSHTQKQKVTQHLIFLTISILQQKIENLGKIWVVDAGYVSFNCFYFITVISTFDTACYVFFYTCFFLISIQVAKGLTIKMF